MAQVPTGMPFLCNGFPAYPGAYLMGGAASFPIFCSIASYTDWGMNNLDDYYLIMPGYCLTVYKSGGYSTSDSYRTHDNSGNLTPMYVNIESALVNEGSSCKLYFGTNTTANEIKSNNSQTATFISYTPTIKTIS